MKKTLSLTFIFLLIAGFSFAQTKKSATKKGKSSTSKTQKAYITMCGEKYEQDANFESFLPSGWEESVGYYCLRNYKEGVSSVSVSGANSKGILIRAIGELTGSAHLVLYTCGGQFY